MTFRLPLEEMERVVFRKSRRVEFVNGVRGSVGDPYVYEFPTLVMAKKFEKLAKSRKAGVVSAIGLEWQKYRVTWQPNRVM